MPVVLDLRDVELVDREAVRFLASFETDNGRSRIVRRTSMNRFSENGATVEAKGRVLLKTGISMETSIVERNRTSNMERSQAK